MNLLRNYTVLFALVVQLVFLVACFKNEKIKPVENIDISEGFNKKDKVLLSQIAADVQYVPLESNENCMIGDIDKIVFNKDLLYIDEGQTNSLLVFNSTGKFLRKIGRPGKGPGEYLSIRDFAVNKKDSTILLYDPLQTKLIMYKLDGTLVKESLIKSYPAKLAFYKDTSIVFSFSRPNFAYNENMSLSFYSKSLQLISRQLDKTYEAITPEEAYGIASTTMARLEYFCDSLSYWEYKYDTVYRVVDYKTSIPRYAIIYNKKIPIDQNLSKKNVDEYTAISNFVETKNYLFCLGSVKQNEILQFMYVKKTKDVLNLFFDHPKFDGGFYNDIDGGWPFLPMGLADGEKLYDVFNPSALKEYMAQEPFKSMQYNKGKRAELNRILESAQVEANPVVMIVKLKS